MSDPHAALDATAQAALVASGEVTPLELVDAAIARVERLNPQLNAVIHTHFDRAREQAKGELPEGPFRGVPFLLKDLGCGGREGDPIHWGTRFLKDADFRSPVTTNIVRRFEAAGLVVIGRTNVPELGAWAVTEPDAYGPTRNPWNPDHSAGGSSGGAAAATAAGIVPFAHASDGGGSIRNPASQCGLVGLKPSRGRISVGPETAEPWAGMTFEFAVTRSVRDLATLLDAVHGEMAGDPYVAPAPERRYADEVGRAPGPLRIGFVDRQPSGEPVHAACRTAVADAAERLARLGHRVDADFPPPLATDALLPHVLNVISSSQARDVERFSEVLGRQLGPEDLDADNWRVTEIGRAVTSTQYIAAIDAYNVFRRDMAAWWEAGHDVLVTPTITAPAPPVGSIVPSADAPMDAFMRSGALLPFCVPFNITGQPAISVPLSMSDDGLPIGIQLVAAYGREDVLVRLASQLEADVRWSERRPPIHA